LSGSQITVISSNATATTEAGEPLHAAITGGRSLWWQWTAPASGHVTISTKGSDFDTLLGVYRGASVSTLTAIASNDDDPSISPASRVQFSATAGLTYFIAADGFEGALGRLTLSLQSTGIAAPRLSAVRFGMPASELNVSADAPLWVLIENSQDLSDWIPISTNRVFGASNSVAVPAPASAPAQFYRAVVLP
jgi:hypothetical protein